MEGAISMVVFECAECDVTMQTTASAFGDSVGDEPIGAYPSQVLTCPRCGARWEQRTSGTLTKRH